eukprot:220337_1
MSDIRSLQNLLNAVNDIHQKIEEARLCVLFQQTSNNSKSSEFHLKFDKLMNKFSGFAKEYTFELNQFHKLTLNNIEIIKLKELQQKNEQERLEIAKKLETISNCNSEIVDNFSDIDNSSSVVSVKYESKQDTIPTPTPISVPVPVPISLPVINPKPQNISKNIVKNTNKKIKKSTKKVHKVNKKVQKSTKKVQKSNVYANKVNKVNKKVHKNDEYTKHMNTPYQYNDSNFSFYGIRRSSTVIFIGNLPKDICQRQINNFVVKRGNVTISQIIEVRIMANGRSTYALVRLSDNVSINKLNGFINKINKENDEMYKQQQIKKDKGTKINNEFISWRKRIFLKFNKFNKFYKSEDEMYNDPKRNHQLFIRN